MLTSGKSNKMPQSNHLNPNYFARRSGAATGTRQERGGDATRLSGDESVFNLAQNEINFSHM